MKVWRKTAGVLFACVISLLPGSVFAHATPISYTPAAGTTELSTPSLISIRFTERIEVGASSIKVYAPDGKEVGVGKGEPDPSDGRVFNVAITDGGEGVYTVSWQVVSVDDGHFTKGAHSFLVDSTGKSFEGDAGGTVIVYVTKFPEAVLSFFSLVGESIFLGALVLLAFVLRPLYIRARRLTESETEKLLLTYTWLFVLGALALIIGNASVFVRKTLELKELQESGIFDAFLVYLASSAGSSYALKIGISIVLISLFLVFKKKLMESPKITIIEIFMWIGTLGILYLQSQSSHAAASFFHPQIAVAVTVFHLFAKELVIGSALIIGTLLGTFLYGSFLKRLPALLAAYDVLAGVTVLIAGVTGAYVSWLHLKSFSHLHTTEWGERFLVLLLLTFFLGGMRLFHQFIIHPRIPVWNRARHILRVTLKIEIIIGLLVLFISGYISITTPPYTVEQYTYNEVKMDASTAFKLEVNPHDTNSMRLSITENNAPLSDGNLILTLTNTAIGIGPNVIQGTERSSGSFSFPKESFSPHGSWELSATYQREGKYDTHALFTITYPEDILATKYSDGEHAYNDFAVIFLFIGGAIVLMSLVLITHGLWRLRRELRRSEDTINATIDTIIPLRLVAIILAICVCALLYASYVLFIQTDFERACLTDGFLWQQSFPVRDFEAVSPNAVSGCTVHDGHYHFTDFAEYRAYIENEN